MKLPLTLYGHARICAILFWLGVAIVVIGGIFSEPLNPHWLMWIGVVVFLSSFMGRHAFNPGILSQVRQENRVIQLPNGFCSNGIQITAKEGLI